MVLLSLGQYKFEVTKTAYSSLARKSSYRWDEKTRIGERSALHFSGENNETISLKGTIYPLISGKKGSESYEDLRREASKGEPLILVDSFGKSHGKWVILGLDANESIFHRSGLAQKIGFTINLKAY
jgi:phage protein U